MDCIFALNKFTSFIYRSIHVVVDQLFNRTIEKKNKTKKKKRKYENVKIRKCLRVYVYMSKENKIMHS